MSNLIKYNYINVNQNEKRVIDLTNREEQFLALLRQRDNVSVEGQDGFIEGLRAERVEVLPEEEVEEESLEIVSEKAEEIINNAKEEAEEIINNARLEAETLKQQALETAKEEGYQEGRSMAEEETAKEREELHLEREQQQQEYNQLLASLEGKFTDIMIAYIEKITGVVVSGRKDVILYLIKNAITGNEQSKSYVIKVSKADYANVFSHFEAIKKLLKEGSELEIFEDSSLEKNQCFIETTGSIIDCSLEVQLKNLISDLKLLSL